MPKKSDITLFDHTKPNGGRQKSAAWRKCKILVTVPVQFAVTDKRVGSWIKEAIDAYQSRYPLESTVLPHKCGKVEIKSLVRSQIAEAFSLRAAATKQASPPGIDNE